MGEKEAGRGMAPIILEVKTAVLDKVSHCHDDRWDVFCNVLQGLPAYQSFAGQYNTMSSPYVHGNVYYDERLST